MNHLTGLNNVITYSAQHLRAFARYPDRLAFTWDEGSLTYRGAYDMIGAMQAVLAKVGLPAGTPVGILSLNRADAWCASIAAMASRYPTTWLHPLGSLDDHVYQMEDAGAGILVIDTDSFAARGEEIIARSSCLSKVFTLGRAVYGIDLLAAVEAEGSHTPRCSAGADDLASLFYTGGTTGKPKGVVRLHRQHSHFASSAIVNFELPAVPRYLAVAPISHVGSAKLLPTWFRGGTVHLHRGFDADHVLADIEKQKINLALLVPTMIYKLLDQPGLSSRDLSSLELLLYGAAPILPARLEEGLARFGPVFSQLYGQSECYPITVLGKADHDMARPELLTSCGVPALDCSIRLLDADGKEVAQGEAGEICVRAPQAMAGYWKQPEQTAEAVRDGWLHTGDVAKFDERGYLYIVDRKKDMIVSGGFNVYPREVELILASHPDVAAVAVVGVPDPTWGEAVMAVVVAREGRIPDAKALTDMVRHAKGSVQAPKAIQFVAELPQTSLGKIDKKALKDQFWIGSDRRVG